LKETIRRNKWQEPRSDASTKNVTKIALQMRMKRKQCCSVGQMVFSHEELRDTFTGRARFGLPRMAVPGGFIFRQLSD